MPPPRSVNLYFHALLSSSRFLLSAQGPFCLAQACSYWRTITESDPRLWTSIYLPLEYLHDAELIIQRAKHIFGVYSKRSQTLSISLTCINALFDAESDKKLVFFLVAQLLTHSHRWKGISLRKLSHRYFPCLLSTPCDLSSLEHLSIVDDGHASRPYTIRLNLKSAKNRKSFEYSRIGKLLVDNVDFHWDQLEEVSFQYGYDNPTDAPISSEHLERLSLCRNITTFSLGIGTGDDIHSQTITLPCLQALRVALLRSKCTIDFLILPQLQTLEINSDSDLYTTSHTSFDDCKIINLLKRSRCSLSHLSIQGANLSFDEILRCLELSSTLFVVQLPSLR